MIISSLIFYYSYVKITYEKCNPKYPSALSVRMKIILLLKGILSETFCPTLYLMSKNKLKDYCEIDEYGWNYLIISFFSKLVIS
jgi:hypothetical protein